MSSWKLKWYNAYQLLELHLDDCLLMIRELAIRHKHETCTVHFTSIHIGLLM